MLENCGRAGQGVSGQLLLNQIPHVPASDLSLSLSLSLFLPFTNTAFFSPFRRVQIGRRAFLSSVSGLLPRSIFSGPRYLGPLAQDFFRFFWIVGGICSAMALPHFPLVDRSCISFVLSEILYMYLYNTHRSCIVRHGGKFSWNLAPFFPSISNGHRASCERSPVEGIQICSRRWMLAQ